MINLFLEKSLIAKCILADDAMTTIANATALSCVSKIFHETINSDAFFKNFVDLVDPHNPFLLLKQKLSTPKNFTNKYLDLRSTYSHKSEKVQGTFFGSFLACEEGLEILSIDDDIISFKQKEGQWEPQSIQVPRELEVPHNETYRRSPYAARSEEYLAISRPQDSTVYIFDPKGKKCLGKCSVLGDIYQIAIKDNLLFIVHYCTLGPANLDVYKLDNLNQDDDHITILHFPSPYPICLGKNHLICREHQYIRILPISFFKNFTCKTVNFNDVPWKVLPYAPPFIRPRDDHFIAAHQCNDGAYEIRKINITPEGLIQVPPLKLLPKFEGRCTDTCVYNDRVFFALESKDTTKIICYDILSGKVSEPVGILQAGGNRSFYSRFLNVASNVHYLIMVRGTDGKRSVEGILDTLTFGKI